MKNNEEITTFCKKYNLTVFEFSGQEKISGYLYLGSVTTLPEGFNPTVITATLKTQGWTDHADPKQTDSLMLVLLLMIPVLALALVTGPQTAVLAELFPARTRYTAVALPHNLSAGWIGGLSPFMVTLLNSTQNSPRGGQLWMKINRQAKDCLKRRFTAA